MAEVDEAYRIAKWWFYKKLAPRGLPWWAEKDDLIQEAVSRLVELAGDPRMTKKSFVFNVIKTAMYDYIRKNRNMSMNLKRQLISLEGIGRRFTCNLLLMGFRCAMPARTPGGVNIQQPRRFAG